jgi:hypothetical protein
LRKVQIPKLLSPCGLHCGWCVYRKIEKINESGCPGCLKREKCPIRDCARKEGRELCDNCASFPCYTFRQGYQSMKEHYTF